MRSAGGEDAQATRSKQCRDLLKTVKDTDYGVVLTAMISEEWRKHQSRFARTWLVSMYAKRKVYHADAPVNQQLRSKVEQATEEEQKRNVMLKDFHLIEAALQTDKTVISVDETVRLCFHTVAQRVHILKHIIWVNPCKDDGLCIEWLHNGAESEQKRLLGHEED